MLIAIIGDVHIGASQNLGTIHTELNINTRIIDYATTLFSTIDEIVEAGCDTLVFTGDIFEHRKPTLVQQKFFSQSLYHAMSKGIRNIHIVVGNHDQQRLNQTTTLGYLKELNLPNIHIYENIESIEVKHAGEVNANLIFLPYRDRKWFGVETHKEALECIQRELDYTIKSIENTAPKILVGHMTIEGTLFNEGYADLYNENQLYLPIKMFNGIDKTILGHIHEPQIVSNDPFIAYVGSMEKRGGFESHNKLYAIINLSSMTVAFNTEPCRSIFDIDIDVSSDSLGSNISSKILSAIDLFAKNNNLKNSITRVNLKILSEDERYLDTRDIMSYLKSKHGVFFCTEVIPSIFSPRQARDDRITEKLSDAEALNLFISNTVDDQNVKLDLINAGLDIIKTLENEDASYQD